MNGEYHVGVSSESGDVGISGSYLFGYRCDRVCDAVHIRARKKNPEASVTATSEWQLTGKIDFHCAETFRDDKAPAAFVLRVEDYRIVESISGVEHVEIRWRNASLAEAKSVVIAHQNAADTGANGHKIPRLVRAAAAAENGSGEDTQSVIPATSAFNGGGDDPAARRAG